MNALKHGLDAQTLILPGEEEAAFQARLDAWRADIRPCDPLEDELVEQAARLSWQLDRADRVEAALLTEHIRLVGEDEADRRDREAAEAAAIGQRLVGGGPRTGGPIPPDDPDHPERLLGRLEATAEGCRWLLDRWGELRAALEGEACWRPEHRLRAVRLLGKGPVDAVDDPMVRSIYLGCFVLGPDGLQVFADQAAELTAREFETFLRRLAGRGFPERIPPERESAREELLALVDGVIEGLESLAAAHRDREDALAATATDRLAFDDSPEAERVRRLQARLMNALLRTIDRLRKAQRDPTASDRRAPGDDSGRHEIPAPSPILTAECEEIRNEPISARPEIRNEPTAAGPAGDSMEGRIAKVAERTHRPRSRPGRNRSGTRIGGTNPRNPVRRAAGRPGMAARRAPRIPRSAVRPPGTPAPVGRWTSAARPRSP